ncbi:MAG TPA: FAD-dependent oxidoreductase [Methanoregulaceae archaeon]|nr:MAG: FAD-dependent oxidoreductase [Methanolinea sp.]HON80761.1 FAD-dependent oxidoreductase [Methanoregulaceae archaeon]HPD09496.1 FAD-dependent oxidoreductase [Methanoregulaceae archaeon]HRT14712.1 FAD-dependent oxidoreductase [Methanoregulaceae archaeon]HRU30285.1 FAD-dependent oxidoreductase [Methanoregulaceae archaeon]
MPRVTVYSTKNCPYCRMVKAFLERQGVDYTSIDVGADKEQAKKMVEISGQYGVPVVTVDGEVIVGFDAQRLNELFGEEKVPELYDVLIIGAGPAGLTAGVYCARKLLKTLVISENIGGQAVESWSIENYMGFPKITGDDLMRKFEEQVRSQDIRLEIDKALILDRSGNEFKVNTATGSSYRARSVILAQGKHPKTLGIEGEDRYWGRGLSVCSTCDGPIFRNKVVAIVGGGNSALQTAIEMSGIAREVHLIVRSRIKADEAYVKLYAKKKNIITHTNAIISALRGTDMLSAIIIRDRDSGKETEIAVDGIFLEIGWIPNTSFVEGLVAMNDQKEIEVDINCHTSVPGIFAAGDVTNIMTKQIITAAGEGAKAALSAYEFLMR